MIQHHNPNDWKDWDKSMSSYQQKLKKNSDPFGWFMLFILLIFIGGWMFACHRLSGGPSVEEQLNDTLFKDHSEIPADSTNYATSGTLTKAVDSLCKDIHPNAEGQRRIAEDILEAKRRDSL